MAEIAGTQYLRYPTDYNLVALNLITPFQNGTVNLMPFMLELNLFEDIYSSTISGKVVLNDSLGLIAGYSLNGTEFIQIQLQKTKDDTQYISRNYRVYKISNRATGDVNGYEVYVINFISEEFLVSEQYRVSKGYVGTQISDIVNDVLFNYLQTNKNFDYDTTSGVYDFVLPNKKLFETINWLSNYAMVSYDTGADMLFYEASDGYHFKSLQNLYGQEAYQSYYFDPKNTQLNASQIDVNQQVRNVLEFEVLDLFNTLNGISNGVFANKLIVIDPLLRTYDDTSGTYNYQSHFNNATSLNDYPITNISSAYQNRLGQTMYDSNPTANPPGLELGALRLATGNSGEKDNDFISQAPDTVANDIFISQYLPTRVGQLALANYTRIKVTVGGDAKITVGKTVNFNIYQITPLTNSSPGTRELDPFYSGKYLVSSIRHIVKNNSYITIMELCKESVGANYPPVNNTNPGTKQLSSGIQFGGFQIV
jgi:hypothetical protein